MRIYRLLPSIITYSDVDDVNRLLRQLTAKPKEYHISGVEHIASQSNVFVWVARSEENRIVGMALVKIDDAGMFTMDHRRAFIGDVVVDESCRGQGAGKRLMERCIETARQAGAKQINLTSNPNNSNRAAAIKLYEKLGFKKIGELSGSNYYRLEL